MPIVALLSSLSNTNTVKKLSNGLWKIQFKNQEMETLLLNFFFLNNINSISLAMATKMFMISCTLLSLRRCCWTH